MAYGIFVIGASGRGKSFSVKQLEPTETVIINIQGKSLPFRGNKRFMNTFTVDKYVDIMDIFVSVSKDPNIKNLIIDDFQYYILNMYASKAGEEGYEKYAEIGVSTQQILNAVKLLRDDQFVVFLNHEEVDTDGNVGVKIPAGRFVQEKVVPEGMFTMVLRAVIHNDSYCFQTQNLGRDICKSPEDMFDKMYIPNDLQLVFNSILAYDNDGEMPVVGESAKTKASILKQANGVQLKTPVAPVVTPIVAPIAITAPVNPVPPVVAVEKKVGLISRMGGQQSGPGLVEVVKPVVVEQPRTTLTREDKISSICAVFGTEAAALKFMQVRNICQTSLDEMNDLILDQIYDNRAQISAEDIASVQ